MAQLNNTTIHGVLNINNLTDVEKQFNEYKLKVDALINFLIQKQLLQENEINEIISSINLMDKMV
jgi:hypothetical protein